MRVVRVVGGALERDGTWLAARRSATMREPDVWEFPGGKVEAGETDESALVRELREELGVEVCVGAFVAHASVARGDSRIELHVYEATIVSGEPQALEHAAVAFFTPEQLPDLRWAEADVPIVRVLVGRHGLR
jgi:mutator protein MutT